MLSNEDKIIEDAKTEPESFGIIFDAYYDTIYTYIYRRLLSAELAEDLSSEVFLKAYQNISSFKWQGHSILNWLYTIAGNELRMHYRKRSNNNQSLEQLHEDEGYEMPSPLNLHEQMIENEENAHRAAMHARTSVELSGLQDKYQEVLRLYYIEDKSISDIAHIIHKKEGTVKSLLHRGRKQLKAALSEQKLQPNIPKRIIQFGGTSLKKIQGNP